jgi:hypothetical protein
MKPICKHIILVSCWLLCVISAFSQVLVKASVDKDRILIGEHVKLSLVAYVPLGQTVEWFQLDTIPHFEFIQKGKIDTSEGIDGKKITQQLVITSFDSGARQIPPLELKVNQKSFFTETIPITVEFSPFDQEKDYHDIKEIVEVENPSLK